MAVSVEKYDPIKIEQLKRSIEEQKADGDSSYYEIFVDNLKVVRKTDDLTRFDRHEDYINEHTKKVRIIIYYSANSPRNNQWVFVMQEEGLKEASQKGLSGADIDSKISERVAQEKERWDNEQVKKDLSTTKQKLNEAEEYIEKLQGELERYKSKKLHLGDVNLGELTSVVVEGMIRRNPQLLSKIPGGKALAGVIEQDNEEQQKAENAKTNEGEASFSKKGNSENSGTLSADQERYVKVIQQMEEHFDQGQLEQVMRIVQHFSQNTKDITEVAELLNIQIKNENEKV